MPIYALNDDLWFPNPALADNEGLLAVGGDLSPERLKLAYESGIFPWYSEDDPILWWSPNPRFVLLPAQLKVSGSMKQILKKEVFHITFNKAFKQVIENCSQKPRKNQDGTWINSDIIQSYYALHLKGIAKSVEVWQNDELVGGLYGIALGKCFFGESMFSHVSNASKAGFITFVTFFKRFGLEMVDCQVHTSHLESLGAQMIDRNTFLHKVQINNEIPSIFDTSAVNVLKYNN